MHRKQFIKLSLLAEAGMLLQPAAALCVPTTSSTGTNVDYIMKGDVLYDELRQGFNKRINKYPQVIAVCKNTTGVAEAVQYARKNNWAVAVKSGGHCMEGFSCNTDGMVINLSAMNKVEWIDKDLVQLGPACKLANLYSVLLPKGKIIPGGSCAGVAVAGLALGGGYGLMSRKLGLTCDSLLEVTMVDGKGRIRSSAADKDLLWACRGGGNGNFGVVTELKYITHPAPKTLQSYRFKTHQATTAKAKTILKKWFEVTPQLPNDCFSAFVVNGKTIYILLTNAGKLTPAVEKVIDELKAATEKTTQTKAQPLQTALKVYYGRKEPLNFKNASAGLYKNFETIEHCINAVLDKVLSTPGMIYQVNTLGGQIQNNGLENTAAFPHRGYSYFSELQTYWEQERQKEKLLQKFQEVQDVFANNGITAQYRNYPDVNFKNWENSYYGANYQKLQQIKMQYDPDNVFRYEQSIKKTAT